MVIAAMAFAAPLIAAPDPEASVGDPVIVVSVPGTDAREIVFEGGGIALPTVTPNFIAVGVFPFADYRGALSASDAVFVMSSARSAKWLCR